VFVRKRKRTHPGFGAFVKARRYERQWTQHDLARLLGCSQSYVSEMEVHDLTPDDRQWYFSTLQPTEEDPAAWLAAAGYDLPEEVAEPSTQYPAAEIREAPDSALIELPIRGVIGDGGEVTPREKGSFRVLHLEGPMPSYVVMIGTYSLQPFCANGDVMTVAEPAGEVAVVSGESVIIQRPDGTKCAAQYRGRKGRTLLVTALNAPDNAPPAVIEGTVVGILAEKWSSLRKRR